MSRHRPATTYDVAMARPSSIAAGKPVHQPTAPGSRRAQGLAAAGLLVCATVLAYWPALSGGFIWDDSGHVTKPALQSLQGLGRIWSELGATQQYYPLLHSLFWIEHRLWGDAALGYHLVNVFLHAGAALLAVAIMRRLGLAGAWLAGLIFALHPVQVEAVAWISEQKSTLSTVFYLASALVYLRFDETHRRRHYLLAAAFFLLALASKTVTATLPAALLVIFWWRRGRLDWKRDALPLAPWFAAGAAGGLFTAWVERHVIGAVGPDYALSFVERVLVAGRAAWFYLGKLVWPANLTFNYPRWTLDTSAWWQYAFPLCALAAIGWAYALTRRTRGPLASTLLFLGALFPALGFFNVFPFVYSYVADHFQYLATLAIICPAASALALTANRLPASARRAVPFAAAGLLLALGSLTFRQSAMYRDEMTLWRETVSRNPESWMAHNNLGLLLFNLPGREAATLAEFETTLRLNPGFANGHTNLGFLLLKTPGRLADAAREFETAIRLEPRTPQAHLGLGDALAQADRLPDAIEEYRTAIRAKPDYDDAHARLGAVLVRMPGRAGDALAEASAAVSLKPDDPASRAVLADALSKTPGRALDAIEQYRAALQFQPDFAEAHYGLANLLSGIPGRTGEAIAEYQAAIRLKPGYPEAHTNLGALLAVTPGRLQDAIAEYRSALRLRPEYMEAHYNLGIALLKSPGNMREAMDHLEAALRLNPNSETVRTTVETMRRLNRKK